MFCNGNAGDVAVLQTANETIDDTYLSFDVQLLATGGTFTQFATYFTIPCVLNLDAY